MKIDEYILVCLMEECSEVIHAASKCLRFGLNDKYASLDPTNLMKLESEIQDLYGVLQRLHNDGILASLQDWHHIDAKLKKLEHFMEYAKSTGTITE